MRNAHELARWERLSDIHANIWSALARAAADRKDEFHTPVVGTVRLDDATGSVPAEAASLVPSLRVVVLRKALSDERELWFHTDVRSGKIHDIRANHCVMWLFYHSHKQYQLRILSKASLHCAAEDDPVALTQWEKTQLLSRRCYCGDAAPGLEAEQWTPGFPDYLQHRQPTHEESERGRVNFAVVRCVVEEIDWLLLNYEGHRRAKFLYDTDSRRLLHSTWLVP
jgi:3-hydroxyisobutyrate dehydrogenase